MKNVLHVHELDRPLLSWPKLTLISYEMVGKDNAIAVIKNRKIFFEAVFDDRIFKLNEVTHTAHQTYDFWQQALGHLVLSSIENTRNLYEDAKVIPELPSDYHFGSSTVSKLIR